MARIADSDLVLQRFYGFVRSQPDAVYLTQPVGGGEVVDYTWSQVSEEARRMAAYLKSLDLPKGTSIAMISKNCAHFVMTDLAIWMAGHVSVALFPTLNTETVATILEHSESKLCFFGKLDDGDEIRRGIPADMPCIAFPLAPANDYPKWDDIIAKTEPLAGEPVRHADELAILVYTSGSTGKPKGVMHSFGTMSGAAWTFQKLLGTRADDRMLSYLPLAHVFERAVVEGVSFLSGEHLYFAESLDTFVSDLRRARPTLFISVPRLWLKFQLGVFKKMPPQKLEKLKRIPILGRIIKKKVLAGLGLDHVRFAGSGSAPIPPDLIHWYRGLGLELLEGYGMSENFSASHISVPGKTRVGYVGNASPGVEHKISPQGEVLVKSPGSMLGYFKEPALSAESFTEDGFLKTGDRGEIDEEGRLKITGRVKELFKTSKGKYVAPVPIENLLNNDHNVELSCVAGSGYPDAYAVVQLSETLLDTAKTETGRAQITAGLEKLLASINGQVEVYERLGFIAVAKDRWAIENGFLTPTMKIKRSVLEEAYGPKLDGWYASKKKVIWE